MQASPNWLTTLVLAVLLAALTWKLAVRAGITWQRESEALAAARAAEGAPDLARPLLAEDGGARVPVAESFEAETFDPPTPMRARPPAARARICACVGLRFDCSSACRMWAQPCSQGTDACMLLAPLPRSFAGAQTWAVMLATHSLHVWKVCMDCLVHSLAQG